ncbi:hypothetical protein JTE90_008499 [Oedothorax gibbosus]|uniref:BTB domain-containing protein n=1 Tax=Oedothorax gibbosus TaxID=931172 RepID=A0AAV6UZ52_9ARAC|nr:hypothetical protein JTE90_008499 [Oedothorax gibbosus]
MTEFGNHDALFTSSERSSTFNLNASKAMFLRYENQFLPSDILSLVINCTFSGHFATDREVEGDIFNNIPTTDDVPASAEVSKTEADETDTDSDEPRQENENSSLNTIIQSLHDILEEGYLSDFNLKRLLKFIYTDKINKDLDWAEASSLYAAADFYALDPLKQVCSEILSDGLCATSALGVLSMADLHHDQQLKSAALDFISLNDKDIIGTKDWIKFEKDNGNLALETFRELYSRKMHG